MTLRSISGASRTPIGLTSTPNDGATAWIAPNSPPATGLPGSRRTAARVTRGAILFEQFKPFPTHAVLKTQEAGGVTARPRQAIDEAGADWIDNDREHDRHVAGRLLQRAHC